MASTDNTKQTGTGTDIVKSKVATDAMKDHNVIPGYRFQLKVNGVFDVPLKSVRPIARKYEYEPIQEGGLNDYVHIKRKPISQPYELVVERYVQTRVDDPLAVGSKMTLPLILYVGRANGNDLSMTDAARWYVFTGAQVLNVEWGGLDSERAALLTETVTIGYNMMFCVSSSSDLNDSEMPYDLQTNEHKYAQKKGIVEKSRENMEKATRLWMMPEAQSSTPPTPPTKEGRGTASRQNATKAMVKDENGAETEATAGLGKLEADKGTMESRRSLWQFSLNGEGTAATVEGNGVRHVQNAQPATDTKGNPVTDANGNSVTTGLGSMQPSKAEMEATAANRLFKFGPDANSVVGNGVLASQNFRTTKGQDGSATSSGIGKPELSKVEMEKKRKRWEFDKLNKDGSGESSRMNRQKAVGTDSKDATSGVGQKESSKADMEKLANDHLFRFGTSKNEVKGNGVVSARKDEKSQNDLSKVSMWEFDQQATDTLNPPMEGNGKRHVQNASKGTGEGGKDTINGIGKVELRKADMEKAGKLWKLTDQYTKEGNGVRSAMNAKVSVGDDGAEVSTGVGSIEEKKAELAKKANLWKFDNQSKDGTGKRSRQNAASTTAEDGSSETSGIGRTELSKEQMEKGASLWNYSGDFRTEGAIATRADNELRKSDMEGRASLKSPIMAPAPNQPKARKWKFSKNSKAGAGTASRMSRSGYNEPSKTEMTGKARKGYYAKRPAGQKAESRLWPERASAISGGNPEGKTPPPRVWPQDKSAANRGKSGKTPAPRLWPQVSSAEKPKKGQKPETRLWPEKQSAAQPKQGQGPDYRKWPETSSAAKNPNAGQKPNARLWPPTRSAQDIADFLMS